MKMSFSRVAVGILLITAVAFAYQCESKTFSDDLNVRIPLKDQNGLLLVSVLLSCFLTSSVFSSFFPFYFSFGLSDRPSMVELTQRFELETRSKKDVTIAINCIAYGIVKDSYQGLYCGDVVVRSDDNGKPGDILFKADREICTNSGIFSWEAYDSSIRVTLPGNGSTNKSVYIGIRSEDKYLFVYGSKSKVQPTADSWMTSNLSKKWEDVHMFYGHVGIDADIIVP